MRICPQPSPAAQALRAVVQQRRSTSKLALTPTVGGPATRSSQTAQAASLHCCRCSPQSCPLRATSALYRMGYTQRRNYAAAASPRPEARKSPLIEEESRPPLRKFVKRWQRLGMNPILAEQVLRSFPHLHNPTTAQKELLTALYKPADVLMRAHTGTGKSLGLLLGLVAKPRVAYKRASGAPKEAVQHVTASLLIVPTNDLAEQYMRWARQLFPPDRLESLDPVIQSQVRGRNHEGLAPEAQVERLAKISPHIIICTPNRLWEMLNEPSSAALLRIPSLRTVVLDEVDALLDLPVSLHRGSKWADSTHPSTCLLSLDWILQRRGTFSGGEPIPAAGLEQGRERSLDERRPPSRERDEVHRNRDKSEATRSRLMSLSPSSAGRGEGLSLRLKGKEPLQLVCVSATAGAVLRHFMGARTGWVRTGIDHEGYKLAYWVDCTGLSAGAAGAIGHLLHTPLQQRISKDEEEEVRESISETAPIAAALPPGLTHHCVVVDPPPSSEEGNELSERPVRSQVGSLLSIRDMSGVLARSTDVEMREHHRSLVLPSVQLKDHVIDEHLLDALALLWTSQVEEHERAAAAQHEANGFAKASWQGSADSLQCLVVIPNQWSLRGVLSKLQELGLPARALGESHQQSSQACLYVHQSASLRGLDIPRLEQVYIVGAQAVQDSRHYVHIAGRAARLPSPHGSEQLAGDLRDAEGRVLSPESQRSRGRIFTLVRGCEPNKAAAIEHALQGKGQGPVRAANKPIIFSSKEMFMARVYRKVGARCTLLRGALPRALLDGDAAAEEELAEDEAQFDHQSGGVTHDLGSADSVAPTWQSFEQDAVINEADRAAQAADQVSSDLLLSAVQIPGESGREGDEAHDNAPPVGEAKGSTSAVGRPDVEKAQYLNSDGPAAGVDRPSQASQHQSEPRSTGAAETRQATAA